MLYLQGVKMNANKIRLVIQLNTIWTSLTEDALVNFCCGNCLSKAEYEVNFQKALGIT